MFSTNGSLSVARLAIPPCLLLTNRRSNSCDVVDLTINKRPRIVANSMEFGMFARGTGQRERCKLERKIFGVNEDRLLFARG